MTSRHPSSHPPSSARSSALGTASKRIEVSPSLQSVRASVDGCPASPCTHARGEVADRAWDLLSEVSQHLGLQGGKKSVSLFHLLLPFLFKVCRWNEETDAAIMSRAPEDVSKITESTYKVSGTGRLNTGMSALDRSCKRILWF